MDYEIDAEESVSTAVVCAVGALEGRDPCSLRPLTDVLDPEALDLLFSPRADGSSRTGGCLSFIYSHCRVTVNNGEHLTIQPLETSPRLARIQGPERADDR